MSDYNPVACATHSEYELAIMQGRRMRLKWHDADGGAHQGVVRPLDLVTRNHAEYLLVEHDGRREEIRLDRIGKADIEDAPR